MYCIKKFTTKKNLFVNFNIITILILKKKNYNEILGKYKYDQDIYDLIMDSFDILPLSCVINGKFIAVHGGISPDLKSVFEKY